MNVSHAVRFVVINIAIGATLGCNLNDLTAVSEELDGSAINVNVIESAEGAQWIYLGGIVGFTKIFAGNASAVARFTDELSLAATVNQRSIDTRIGQSGNTLRPYVSISGLASDLQQVKVQMEQAIQLLKKHYDASGNTMQAHMYGLLGMVHLILADNFCSGVALSESKWGGEFTPGAGYSTDSIYWRAVKLFDKGLSLNPDSAEVTTLLLVGKARALNALGRWSEAAQVASGVADGDSIWMRYVSQASISGSTTYIPSLFVNNAVTGSINDYWIDTTNFLVRNEKGTNGLTWVTADPQNQDERVAIRTAGAAYVTPWKPTFYFTDRTVHIADGREARLIEAEYHLQAGEIPEFLENINRVRRMHQTLGGTTLSDTTDPGTNEGRVDLLFRERAYTFYVTGRRLGDYRRLVRQYGRAPQHVYPTGIAEGKEFVTYGDNYVFAPENREVGREVTNNPLYRQCHDYAP